MAAAGPSTRASSAAAAAALSRRGRRGRCDEMAAAKTGAPGPASGPALLVFPSPLLQPSLPPRSEESGCAGCLETPRETAALPCGHSLCQVCAQRAADAAGPGCPRCRASGLGWARRRVRDSSQADAEVLGERVRRGQPERCRPRRDGGAAVVETGPELEPRAAPADPEFIFRAPVKLNKSGELREEHESPRKNQEIGTDFHNTSLRTGRLYGTEEKEKLPEEHTSFHPFRVPQNEPAMLFQSGSHEILNPLILCINSSASELREEKLQEEKTSEDQSHKLLVEDTETGKRKMDEQKRRDEPLALKSNLEHCPARLSDSENEEPSKGKTMQTHRSAFVSKNNSYSLTFLAGNLNSKLERSQSCSDTAQDRTKSRLRAAPASKTKVTTMTPASNPIIGVLLSTQNSRCLSAPDLTIEKRLPFSSLSSLASLHKPERSISPESNDSISEELNHFKPIVCSPCTPPKRLPDGRVLSPLIIKSTPRNLNRSLQKQTSYETSPRILKKWEQIFQERQIKKTLSKATLTSQPPETGEDLLVSEVNHLSKEKPVLALNARLSSGQVLSQSTGPNSTDLDFFPSATQVKAEQGSDSKRNTEIPLETCCSSELKGETSGSSLERELFEGSGSTPDVKLDKPCLSTAMKISAGNSLPPRNNVVGGVLKTKKQMKTLNHFDLPNGILVDNLGEEPLPPLRRGRKRHCKTKHLEQNGSLKKLRQSSGEVGLAPTDPVLREVEQKLQQEEEDRQLALQLQRMFDNERRTVSRRKGSVDQYLLRSSNVAGAK